MHEEQQPNTNTAENELVRPEETEAEEGKAIATEQVIPMLGFGSERNIEQAKLLARSLGISAAESEELREAVLENWRGESGNFHAESVSDLLGAFGMSPEDLKNDQRVQICLADTVADALESHNTADAIAYLSNYFNPELCNEYCARTLRAALDNEKRHREGMSEDVRAPLATLEALLEQENTRP